MTITHEDIARVCHEANRALQQIQAAAEDGPPTIPVSAPWDEETEAQQASVLAGVHGVIAGKDPRESHEAWAAHKSDEGWTWGPVKDEVLRQHPLLLHYDDLPAEAAVKDDLFAGIVNALAPLLVLEPKENPE